MAKLANVKRSKTLGTVLKHESASMRLLCGQHIHNSPIISTVLLMRLTNVE